VNVESGNLPVLDSAVEDLGPGDLIRVDGYGRVDVHKRRDDGSYRAPRGFYSTVAREADGSFTERDHRGVTARYAAPDQRGVGRLKSLSDRFGNTMRFEHDAQGQLIRVIDTLGRAIQYVHNAQGRLAYVQDLAGRRISFQYDARGDLVAVTSPAVTGTPNGNDFRLGKTRVGGMAVGGAMELLEQGPELVASWASAIRRNKHYRDLDRELQEYGIDSMSLRIQRGLRGAGEWLNEEGVVQDVLRMLAAPTE
jgi:YD repeat-containing protein